MHIVDVDIKRSHYGATVEEVSETFNVGNGTSTLLAMAIDPEHRPKVEAYREVVDWKLANTEGEPLAKWRAVANHLDIVLSASRRTHNFTARQLAQAA